MANSKHISEDEIKYIVDVESAVKALKVYVFTTMREIVSFSLLFY
jgi:hypothetical protein